MSKESAINLDTLLYFAYGSNLWSFRIHMNIPSAQFVSIGRLDNYRLDFIKYSKFWGGPTATPVPTANAHVWGVVWRLHVDDIEHLDTQEGVDKRIYYVKHLEILTPHQGMLICRSYINVINPLPRGDNDKIPIERWPSWSYMTVIMFGAMEHELPQYYIQYLKRIKHNNEQGCFFMECLLRRYSSERPCICPEKKFIDRRVLKLDVRKLRAKEGE
ncbi:gamma-glutamylcyclotransferase-like [Leptidea sinapis]|uniref:gamma-glutamylcyclotransferase-like n=1 Tax=Leptidea sinapis TaxID=189913 RepID=UPI0021334CFF|nr:gamma-glutamylcyclotransferase-like [Leptidea sinapis]